VKPLRVCTRRRRVGELKGLDGLRHLEIGVFGFCLNYLVLLGGLSGEALPGCLI